MFLLSFMTRGRLNEFEGYDKWEFQVKHLRKLGDVGKSDEAAC